MGRCLIPSSFRGFHRKESLWPYIQEFADNSVDYITAVLTKMADCGEACELYAVHGHYADASEVAALVAHTLGVTMVMTGHSLGKNKLVHLLKSGKCCILLNSCCPSSVGRLRFWNHPYS